MEFIKGVGRVVKALFGFLYDLERYILFSGWSKDLRDPRIRHYHTLKVHHALEKSMSFIPRNPRSGWKNAFQLLEACEAAQLAGNIADSDHAAVTALINFTSLPENLREPEAPIVRRRIDKLFAGDKAAHGTIKLTKERLRAAQLDAPEDFFLLRYSLRDFDAQSVPQNIIARAIQLASKAPSACNRQPWRVYHTTNPAKRDAALALQSGNRGFTGKIPTLLVLAVDLSAFMPGEEHYQHWIDGGMFAMSLVHAFHALGIGTCCLNWSVPPGRDRRLRKLFKIAPSDTVIMMLAVGYPKQENIVCASLRSSNPILIELEHAEPTYAPSRRYNQ